MGRSGPPKTKEQRPREGRRERMGYRRQRTRGVSEKSEGNVRLCVCVCRRARARASLPLCLSRYGYGFMDFRRFVMCVFDPWAVGGGWERGDGRGEEEGGRGPPPARPLAGSTPSVRLGGGRGALQEQSLTRAGWGREGREGEDWVGGTGERVGAGKRQGAGSTSVMPKGMLPT